tara:strand:- start:453 stop:1334 length:882 start_codon:yes stop_codon:yes gene_type:complete
MIRDVTGLNEARDGSTPAKDALVGLQKLAAANSNTATRHILQSLMHMTVRTCENVSLRVADMLSYPLTKNALIKSINNFNTSTLEEVEKLHIHEFGIFLELEPDEEEKAMLEKTIQIALQAGNIGLEDAIDIREISNLKLANQVLKQKQKKKAEAAHAKQLENIKTQAEANAKSAEKTALADVQKEQAIAQTKIQIEQAKSQFEIERMEQETALKKQLMAEEFQYQLQLAQMEAQRETTREAEIEDRKDNRTRIQATQQSEMINQRQNDLLPTNFESNNDSLGGFGLDQFDPK